MFGPCVHSNGLGEIFNQVLQRMLVKAITGQKELWDEFIDSQQHIRCKEMMTINCPDWDAVSCDVKKKS